MNVLYWAAFGLIMLGLVLVVLAAYKGAAKLNRAGITALLAGSLANAAYWAADGSTGLTTLWAVLSFVNLVTLFVGLRDRRKRAAAK